MLSTQLNFMAEENRLAPNCVCILKKHVTNILKDKRYAVFLCNYNLHIKILPTFCIIVLIIISKFSKCLPKLNGYNAIFCYYRRVVIILEMEVIKSAEDVAGRIGEPTPYTEGKPSNHIS